MNTRNNPVYVVTALLIGVMFGVFVAPTFIPSGGNVGMMRGRGGQFASGLIDKHFIEQMIPHHDGAIAMAKLALERSKRTEILSLAEGIIEAQTLENIDMRTWYENWFGTYVPIDPGGFSMMGHGGMSMMNMGSDLERLRVAQDFDLEFIRQMIPHHEVAIMMAQMLAAGSGRKEMQTLANQIITSQRREVEMMGIWYQQWSLN